MMSENFKPLDATAKRGQAVLVRNEETGDYAKAYWHHDMWALYAGPDYDTIEQLSFEPLEYVPLNHA